MHRASVTLLFAASLGALAACSSAPSATDGAVGTGSGGASHAPVVGSATVTIKLAPTSVSCVSITTVGTTQTTQSFEVTPEQETVFSLASLPLGVDTFTALAYPIPCAQVGGDGATGPSYVSQVVTATVVAGSPVNITFEMEPVDDGGTGTAGIDFPTLTAGTVTLFPTPTAGSEPTGIAAGPDGNLWFAEAVTGKVGHISTGGVIAEVATLTGGAYRIAAGPDGNLWVTETQTSLVARVTPSGTFTEFSTPTAGADPLGITAGPDGNIWFTEPQVGQIGRINPGGGSITEFALPVSSSQPNQITTGADGNLWFTVYTGNQIGRITPEGTITEFGIPTPNAEPWTIETGGDGNLWFAELGGSIGRSSTSGAIVEFPVPGVEDIAGIAPGPDGNIWFGALGAVGFVTEAGAATVFPVPTTGIAISLTTGPDGNIWFADNLANLGRVIP
jgi:streptogramin lyase